MGKFHALPTKITLSYCSLLSRRFSFALGYLPARTPSASCLRLPWLLSQLSPLFLRFTQLARLLSILCKHFGLLLSSCSLALFILGVSLCRFDRAGCSCPIYSKLFYLSSRRPTSGPFPATERLASFPTLPPPPRPPLTGGYPLFAWQPVAYLHCPPP